MILHSHNQKNEKDDSATGNTQITNDYINTPETNELRIYTDENKITGKYENEQESKDSVIIHEILHLLEYTTSDNNSKKGIEDGI